MVKILGCSIIKRELDYLIKKHRLDVDIKYLDCALHAFPEQLCSKIESYLEGLGETVLVYGHKCCAHIERVAAVHGAVLIGARNCIEMILGPDVTGREQYKKAFFLTAGWFESWYLMVKKTLKWDRTSARLNFGYCDRMLFVDTGSIEISDREILDISDYTGLPVEKYITDLSYFENLLLDVLKKVR